MAYCKQLILNYIKFLLLGKLLSCILALGDGPQTPQTRKVTQMIYTLIEVEASLEK
jgi:hypothetical protein